MLYQRAPGLTPEPLDRRVERGAPVIEMTRVPGEPLGAARLSPAQAGAVAGALTQMHRAASGAALTSVPERRWGPAEVCSLARSWIQEVSQGASAPAAEALRAARAWLSSGEAGVLPADQVFGNADGNLANFLWDGARCRIVDFEDSGVSDPAYEAAHVSRLL
jgi:Ser/Thr protein kinase RdoA (MazF antagonist)